MTDNYINATVTSKQNKKVTVSTQDPGYEVTATTDTGKFWAKTAERWATSDTIVDNTDYSSKYYANKAKVSEENARVYESSVKNTYNTFIAESGNITDEVRNAGQEGLNSIEASRLDAVDSINTVKNESIATVENKANEALTLVNNGISEINTTKNSAVSSINTTKTSAITEINNTKTTAVNAVNTSKNQALNDIEKESSSIINFKEEVNAELENKVDLEDMVAFDMQEVPCITETYINGTSWYRVWSDGWCEQGGYIKPVTTSYSNVSLLKTYKDTNYSLQLSQCNYSGQDANYSYIASGNRTNAIFQIIASVANNSCSWRACGYIA